MPPFYTDKHYPNGNNTENDEMEIHQSIVTEIFNDYFASVTGRICFHEYIISIYDVFDKHGSNRIVLGIKGKQYVE